ncbi:unnamed protein product (macronuclear) [Paramecium tetraurelia]|uniref:ubiquitinyl hydrolase 1 n=1 Tax=Paramecium tetraurelia TaxID=5888 RepID=A0DP51_PARTE|nr:uncharacterized protein GSPATT00018999001 [Paramecium tetraurelia]CAK84818.1 unnamed protein product [Paramecium tetraurelia]|eukprot:XP_001452215.1 hypothetical protein (macronuclear) [Paramecium tetraurelia strain d4-2]
MSSEIWRLFDQVQPVLLFLMMCIVVWIWVWCTQLNDSIKRIEKLKNESLLQNGKLTNHNSSEKNNNRKNQKKKNDHKTPQNPQSNLNHENQDKQDSQESIEKDQVENSKKQKQIESLKQKESLIEQQSYEINNLKIEYQSIKKENERIQEENKGIKEENITMKEAIQKLEQLQNQIQSEMKEQKKKLNEMPLLFEKETNKKNDNFQEEMKQLKNQLQGEIRQLQGEIKQLIDQVQNQQAIINDQSQEVRHDITKVNQNLEILNKRLERVEEQILDQKNQIQKIGNPQEKIEQLTNEIQKMKEDLKKLIPPSPSPPLPPSPPPLPQDDTIISKLYNLTCRARSVQPQYRNFVSDFQNQSCLIQEYSFKMEFKNKLKQQLNGMRRARGDGNCFYTSFVFQYLDFMINNSKNAQYEQLIQQISMLPFEIYYGNEMYNQNDFDNMKYKFIGVCQHLRSQIEEERQNQFFQYFKDEENEFYGLSIVFLRNLAFKFCSEDSEISVNFQALGLNLKEQLLEWEFDCQSNENVITILSQKLNIHTIVFQIENQSFQILEYNFSSNPITKIYLLFQPGHYNIGIPKVEQQLE